MRIRNIFHRSKKEIKLPTVVMLNGMYGKLKPKSDFIERQHKRGKLAAKVARNIAEQLRDRGRKVNVELAQKMAFAQGALKHFAEGDAIAAQKALAKQGYAQLARGIGAMRRGIIPKSVWRMSLEEKILAYADYACRGVSDADGIYVHKVYSIDDAYEIAKKAHDEKIHPFIEQKYKALKIIEQELVKLGFDTRKLQGIRI